jgi:uncharacterized membrane protein YphA (DoxX/SURF4 family)
MNIFLWVLQVVIALHTIMGAVWKFSHGAEQTMPALKIIPPGIWLLIACIEVLCAVFLVLPALYKPAAILVPIAAIGIAVIMLAFCAINLLSGSVVINSIIYWLVVATICAFVAYGRLMLRPF